jgi:hypothetical protein
MQETALLDYPLLIFGTAAFAVWLGLALVPRLRSSLAEPWAQVLGFTSLAGLAGLTLFTKRGYAHYVMLIGPFMIIAAVIAGMIVARWAGRTLASKALVSFIALTVAAIPLVPPAGFPYGIRVWPPSLDLALPFQVPWYRQPAVDADLKSLRPLLAGAARDVLVLPPIRNDVHLILGTRSVSLPQGYGWEGDPREVMEALRSRTLQAVIVIRDRNPRWDANQAGWRLCACDAVVASLPEAGFRLVAELRTMALWRR